MTKFQLSLAATLATVSLALAGCPAMAQGSDRMPGGVERSPDVDFGRSRGLTPSPPPPPAPATAAPAAPTTAPKPSTAVPVTPDVKQNTDSKSKKSKKSSKGTGESRQYRMESAPAERSITPGGDDKRVGGVERSPETRGSQP